MNNQELMQRIKDRWSDAVRAVCATSSIPEAFVAALIANESEGDPSARRFEPGVFQRLEEVREGGVAHYGRLTQAHLKDVSDDGLRVLATSYGLTQIMGYNAVYHGVDPLQLYNFSVALPLTIKMLAEFCEWFDLDPKNDLEDLFTSWNAGHPGGQAVPGYVANGIERMTAYEALPA